MGQQEKVRSRVIIKERMDDSYSPKGLREEWSLLLHSFLDEQVPDQDLMKKINSQNMTLDQIKTIKKELSSKRKKMNQSIEKIKIKIEQVSGVIENLELVGSDVSGLQKEVDLLNQEGQRISKQIFSLDLKLKQLHDLHDSTVALNL